MCGSQLQGGRQLGAQLADGYRIHVALNADEYRVLASLLVDHQRFHRATASKFSHRPAYRTF